MESHFLTTSYPVAHSSSSSRSPLLGESCLNFQNIVQKIIRYDASFFYAIFQCLGRIVSDVVPEYELFSSIYLFIHL